MSGEEYLKTTWGEIYLRNKLKEYLIGSAQGFGRFHFMDKTKFYLNARGSLYKLKSHLLIAKELGFISKNRCFFGIIGIIPAGKFGDYYMSNPFKYSVVVSGNDFADREKELKELVGKLKENVRIFLVAPRRYGKTSLLKNALEKIEKRGLLTAYVDLYWVTSSKEFFEFYLSSLLRGSKSITKRVLYRQGFSAATEAPSQF